MTRVVCSCRLMIMKRVRVRWVPTPSFVPLVRNHGMRLMLSHLVVQQTVATGKTQIVSTNTTNSKWSWNHHHQTFKNFIWSHWKNWASTHWNTMFVSLKTTGKTHQLVQLVLVGKFGLTVWKLLSLPTSNKLVAWQLDLLPLRSHMDWNVWLLTSKK